MLVLGPLFGPLFLNLLDHNPNNHSKPSLCYMEPCGTMAERSIQLHTSYCHNTRKMLVFGPFLALKS